jgi:phosphoribosyl 1,2-cyclic phosphate phosphodiesterase
MKVTLLGTAAAEGIPSAYCNCPTCEHARANLGKNVRKRTCALINDDLLIDNGPDLYAACGMYGISLNKIKYNLITHNHGDHFFALNLTMRSKGFRRKSDIFPLHVAAAPSTFQLFDDHHDESIAITRQTILPNTSFELPPYTIKTLEASHHERSGDAMNFIISDGKSQMYYGCDTGIYKDAVWDHMAGHKLDLIIMESTGTETDHQKSHLNYPGVLYMLERMEKIGAKHKDSIVYVIHFSHQGGPSHEELEKLYSPHGIQVSYDGLVLDL